jgi:hypothetical protein
VIEDEKEKGEGMGWSYCAEAVITVSLCLGVGSKRIENGEYITCALA